VRTFLAILLGVAACGGDDAPATDAAVGSDSGGGGSDAALNMATSLVAAMANTRTLDHAVYGVNNDDGTLHVEIYKGGDPGCPTMTSATPEYTAIIGRVPPMNATTATSGANFLDYQGDMLGGALGAAATTVMLTNVVYQASTFVTLDAQLTFAAGTVTGHLYAVHCPSLDG